MAVETLQAATSTVYDEMVVDLRRQVQQGHFAKGDRIPTEAELSKKFGISIRSVRSGIEELVVEGLLIRRQGSGTFVRQGRPRLPAPVRTDTVAVLLPLAIRGYHPYFSEMLRGIREGIDALGLTSYEFSFENQASYGVDVTATEWDSATILEALNSRQDLAGIICGATTVATLKANLQADVPLVAADPTDDAPYVSHDWGAEMDLAIFRQISAGRRNLWVYGSERGWQPSFIPPGVTIHRAAQMSADRGLLSAHIRHAYDEAIHAFDTLPDLDGVVVFSDFEAQGVLDAAVKAGLRSSSGVSFTCIVNRESRLSYPFPLTLQIADGYLKGRRLVELLHQHTQSRVNSPSRIILRCDEEHHLT